MADRFLTITTNYIPKGECWLMIGDYRWWNSNSNEIKEWAAECLTNGLVQEGMIVRFSSKEDRNVFIMRWANV